MSQIEVKRIVKEYQRKKHYTNMGKAFSTMFRPEYEVKRAVDDVSFSIEKGESVGYVGPNGSGKSTTIKMLCGILCPTEGSIRVRGIDPFKERTKNSKNIGVVFGNRSVLWWDVPVIESYKVLQQLYEIPESQFQENLEKFQDIMGIGPLLSVPERQLSLGQRMRCNIAAAFLHNPEIVYLDEPTIGLDSESKESIRKCILDINEEAKTTFIVTSHDFQDIETLCRRIMVISHGNIVLDDMMANVRQEFNKEKKIRVEMAENPWFQNETFSLPGTKVVLATPHSLVVEYDVAKTQSISVLQEVAKRTEIQDVEISSRDIESIIQGILRKEGK